MVSAESEPIMGVRGVAPVMFRGKAPTRESRGRNSPEAENIRKKN